MGHSVSRLRDFNDYDSSPFSARRPSSHTAYLPDQASPSQVYTENHLPSFHHDHLHHAGQDVIGVSTLQPNSQRRERAREALLRRNCDHNVSIDSGQSHSGSSRTTENPTEQTVVHRQPGGGAGRLHPSVAAHLSSHSLHSAHSGSVRCDEDQNSDSHLSSEDNLSHESYDLLDKEEEAAHMNTYSENIRTVLSRSEISFDNSLSYSIPHTPSKMAAIDDNVIHDIEQSRHSSYREDLINSNLNSHSKPNSHSSTYSSLSTSPLPDPQLTQARRRSSGSGTLSQRSKNSKDSLKSESRVSLRESHFLSEDCSDGFHGHEIHMETAVSASPHSQVWPDKIINKNHQQQKSRDPPGLDSGGMHENIIFQSPTNIKYFSPQRHQQTFSSRTLPNRRRREKSPVVFTTGKLSVDCSSASSSSQASPRMCRPKSLDFSVVALQDLPQTDAYSYRDDTIEQQDFEDNSSSTFSVQNNYASSSDVPQTPELGGTELASSHSSRAHISGRPIATFNSSKHQSLPFHGLKQERIYDIPEGIEREEIPISATKETRTVFQSVGSEKPKCYKNYLEITRKFSSEESESTSHKPKLKILPPPRVLKKVSSTESESAISNNSHQSLPAVQFDSDTLSLPLDLISPPLESESSTAMVESESLPAPPQFGSNKDDTDIEDEVTPRGEETNSESQDQNGSTNFSLEQPEKSKFGFRVAPPALQNLELVPPTRQESTYESRAERMLESQLTRVDTFTEDHARTREIVDLDKHPSNGKKRENVLLKALDSYDSFSNDQFQISNATSSRQESLTYEENAESALEKQTTVESFTSQLSEDNDVFYDQSIENKVQELNDPNFTNRRDQILESQSTFESFTTECEVIITKRQESTYEERAETVLESQNTIESFTNEVPNDEVFDHEPPCSESSFLHDDCETQIEKTDDDLVAEMYVRHLPDPDCESDIDNVPFMDDPFDQDLLISSGGKVACGQGDRIIYNNFVKLPAEEPVETVFLETQPSEELDPEPEELTGAYDTEPPPPIPPDDFGSFTVPHEPLYYRADGFRGSFAMRTLSRISEKSSNESASTPSDTPAAQYDHSDHEQNYTTSEDNENAPSISSDLPENMAPEDSVIPNPLEDLRVEFGCDSSQEESLKNTECTQLDQDTLEDEEDEDLDETNAEEIKTEERDLPPDFRPELTNSITSENEVTNKDSDGSLHDSMEILEEVNTEDRFDHDVNRCSFEGSEESQRQIQWRVTVPKSNMMSCQANSKPALLKKPSVSLSENSGKYVVTEGSEEVIL